MSEIQPTGLPFTAYKWSPSFPWVLAAVQGHAVDTYSQFLEENEAELKALPPPQVALEYYKSGDMYLYDAMHKDGNHKQRRRPPCE